MLKIDPRTRFADLAEREKRARDAHVNTVARLKNVKEKRALSTTEKAELDRSNAILKRLKNSDKVCDSLFVATRALLNDQQLINRFLRTQVDGVLKFVDPSGRKLAKSRGKSKGKGKLPLVIPTLTLGLLIVDGVEAPRVTVRDGDIAPDENDATKAKFTQEFFRAMGEARGYGGFAGKVLAQLGHEGDPDGQGGVTPSVRCEEFANVMRHISEAKVGKDEPQLRRRVNEMLDRVQRVGSGDRIADQPIELPDLEQIVDQNIIKENVLAMGPMIVSAMFDELKVFQVVDRIVEQFQAGFLPIGPGNAGTILYQYWREAPNRMSEQERRNFAAITLGIPGGDSSGQINRDFNDLWIRFVSSVSSFVRQSEVDFLLRSATPSAVSHQQVRKAARDLASNLSLHGYGMAHYAAREVQSQVKLMIQLLSDPEIRGCYGAKDMWQVIDQVATYDLGGAKTGSRYRTLATCGTIITAWLANNVIRINRTTGPLINIDEVRNPPVAASHKATTNPNDYDLVNACELWLADTATSDREIERLSQEPRDTPTMTSKPIPVPAMAREMLEGLGDMGVGLGHAFAVPPHPAVAPGNNGHRWH